MNGIGGECVLGWCRTAAGSAREHGGGNVAGSKGARGWMRGFEYGWVWIRCERLGTRLRGERERERSVGLGLERASQSSQRWLLRS